MSAETDLQTLLAGTVAITNLVGTHIGADRAEEDWTRPYIVYARPDTVQFRGLDGTVAETKVTFEVQCWGDTRTSAEACADACTTAIDGGTHGDVVDRSTGRDAEMDLEATILTVEWWQ